MLKMIYLAKRKPGFSFDGFVRRWRKHGALAIEQPLWRQTLGYVQAEPIRPQPFVGASEDYDAIACYMVRDGLFTEMTEEDATSSAIMAEDELKTFAEPIPATALWVKEERVLPGELGGITAFLFFNNTANARESAQRASASGGLNRITLNTRDDGMPRESQTLPYQAVVELSAASIPALEAALEAVDVIPTSDLAVITREAVLWHRMS
ncbi:hypothetical protein CWI75_16735 [Kineobactrum sediminis]|uniref:EthD domain-containing protein n=1 Tax=Kineobactrum sediminis TaxID=1905677 RepID=A0A2N5XYS3_9GAMM|nr:hypothetical protein [Kineobactrum sediminis]PLW81272.1 hypothetical protein CWI75_16735 [Kineobactrum sediminis]